MKNPRTRSCPPHAVRGIALVMALVFLLLLTLLGISALNTTSLEEKMAGNVKDRNLAFQAAESALIQAEYWLYSSLTAPEPGSTPGTYQPSTTSVQVWDSVNWSGSGVITYPNTPDGVAAGSATLSNVNTQPKYIVEYLRKDAGSTGGGSTGQSLVVMPGAQTGGTTYLRITARGTGSTNAATVMLQSTYAREY